MLPPSAMAARSSSSSSKRSSTTGPLLCGSIATRALLAPDSPANVVRNDRSRLAVLASGAVRCRSRSARPTTSSSERKPCLASSCRTSSPTNWKKLTTSSGVPGKRARSSSLWLATPTGQLFVWQIRAMMQPVAIIATVPKPYSSAPSAAMMMTSRPLRRPPSARRSTRSRSSFATSAWCVSATPISTGPPACLIDEIGDAPVPPSCPETCTAPLNRPSSHSDARPGSAALPRTRRAACTPVATACTAHTWMTSAFALATPEATVPMPASPTSLTLTLAVGWIMCRS